MGEKSSSFNSADDLREEEAAADEIPVVDLAGFHDDGRRRREILEAVGTAAERWGFFHVVNHGIPLRVLEEMKEGVRRFHEGDKQVKEGLITVEAISKVKFKSILNSNGPIRAWKETLIVEMGPHPPSPHQIPSACRDILLEYVKQIAKLGETLFEIISEVLGLLPHHLKSMECTSGVRVSCHYYPPFPAAASSSSSSSEDDSGVGIGAPPHTDPSFLTLLLQDTVGGLQILNQQKWVSVRPIHGSVTVNIGDLLQLISNDKLKSVVHRVLVNPSRPRISVACFFNAFWSNTSYAPLKELLSHDKLPLYKEITSREFLLHFMTKGVDFTAALADFRL